MKKTKGLNPPYSKSEYLPGSKESNKISTSGTTKALPSLRATFKETQRRLREDAILAAARQLLFEKGYYCMSIEDVVDSVGISKPTFYGHFPSKEALAIKVMVRELEAAQSRLDEFASILPPAKAAQALIEWAIDNQLSPDSNSDPVGVLPLFCHGEVRAAENRLTENLAELINKGQKDGSIHNSISPAFLAQTFRSIIKDTAYTEACRAGRLEVSRLKLDIVNLLVGG